MQHEIELQFFFSYRVNLHLMLSPFFGLVPLRVFVSLVIIILFAVSFANHLLPVAKSPLLLQRPPRDVVVISVGISGLIVNRPVRFLVVLLRA
jgi:hypothetical protein